MSEDILKSIPKVDLHCHLDGSIRTQTIIDLAKKQNHELPAYDIESLRPYVRVPLDCKCLGDFLKRFEVFYPLLTNSYALERISYELLRDCAQENTKYMEIRFAPILQTTEDFPMPAVIESVLNGVHRAEAEFEIKCGVLLCMYRSTPLADSMQTAKFAAEYKKDGVCGVDVAGDEGQYPINEFRGPIEYCKKEGVNVTIHAGEGDGPKSIQDAIELGTDRIGHGVRLVEDEKLMAQVAEKGIPLEICLTSNIQTQVIEDYSAHPFLKLIDNGVKVTLNTDDRGVSGIDLTYEYQKAMEYGLPLANLKKIIINGLDSAFVEEEKKNQLRTQFFNKLEEV